MPPLPLLLLLIKAWLHVLMQSPTPATHLTSADPNQGTTSLPPSLPPALPPCTVTTSPRNTTPNSSSNSSNSSSITHRSNINPQHITPSLTSNNKEEEENEEEENEEEEV
jgi:hypothetical protein